jgi:hypothetical protein
MYTSDENHSTRRNGQSRSWGKENALRLLGQVSRCAIALVSIFRCQLITSTNAF